MKLGVQHLLLLSVFVLATCLYASEASAGDYVGCLVCEEDSGWFPWTAGQKCAQVGDGQYGNGIECSDGNEGLGWSCEITVPYPCYNVDVYGGGGGYGGPDDQTGGGGSGCQWDGGICPAYCSSCN